MQSDTLVEWSANPCSAFPCVPSMDHTAIDLINNSQLESSHTAELKGK